MVVGIVDHATGTRDIRRLAWLGGQYKPLFVVAAAATASMAALPPFLGFVAKEADFETLAHSASLGSFAPFVLAGVVFGSVFTTIYSLRFLYGAFARKGRDAPSQRVTEMHRPPTTFLLAPAIRPPQASVRLVARRSGPGARRLCRHRAGGADYDLACGRREPAPAGAGARRGHPGVLRRNRLRRARQVSAARQRRPHPDAVIRGADVFAVRLTAD
jgi:multicomponent Na+:H+ antiporter subunit A